MKDLVSQAKIVQDFIEARGWPFCIIGGVALLRWGEPRLTRDIDLCLFTDFGEEDQFSEALLARFAARIPNARDFARTHRVLLLSTPAGHGLDVAYAGLPLERDLIERSTKADYQPGIALRTCSAEDLVVLKAFAARPQDWIDVRNVAIRQRGSLDWPAIYERLTPLVELKGEPEILARLRAIETV